MPDDLTPTAGTPPAPITREGFGTAYAWSHAMQLMAECERLRGALRALLDEFPIPADPTKRVALIHESRLSVFIAKLVAARELLTNSGHPSP